MVTTLYPSGEIIYALPRQYIVKYGQKKEDWMYGRKIDRGLPEDQGGIYHLHLVFLCLSTTDY